VQGSRTKDRSKVQGKRLGTRFRLVGKEVLSFFRALSVPGLSAVTFGSERGCPWLGLFGARQLGHRALQSLDLLADGVVFGHFLAQEADGDAGLFRGAVGGEDVGLGELVVVVADKDRCKEKDRCKVQGARDKGQGTRYQAQGSRDSDSVCQLLDRGSQRADCALAGVVADGDHGVAHGSVGSVLGSSATSRRSQDISSRMAQLRLKEKGPREKRQSPGDEDPVERLSKG